MQECLKMTNILSATWHLLMKKNNVIVAILTGKPINKHEGKAAGFIRERHVAVRSIRVCVKNKSKKTNNLINMYGKEYYVHTK